MFASNGDEAKSMNLWSSIFDDGNVVAFDSFATNLIGDDSTTTPTCCCLAR